MMKIKLTEIFINRDGMSTGRMVFILFMISAMLCPIGLNYLDRSIFFNSVVSNHYKNELKIKNAMEMGRYLLLYKGYFKKSNPFELNKKEQNQKQSIGELPIIHDLCGSFDIHGEYVRSDNLDVVCPVIFRLGQIMNYEFESKILKQMIATNMIVENGNQYSIKDIDLSLPFDNVKDQDVNLGTIFSVDTKDDNYFKSDVWMELLFKKEKIKSSINNLSLLEFKGFLREKVSISNGFEKVIEKMIREDSLAVDHLTLADFAIFIPFPIKKMAEVKDILNCIQVESQNPIDVKSNNRDCHNTTLFSESIGLNKWDKIFGKVFFNGDFDISSKEQFDNLPVFNDQVIISGNFTMHLPPTKENITLVKSRFKKGIITNFSIGSFLVESGLVDLIKRDNDECWRRQLIIREDMIESKMIDGIDKKTIMSICNEKSDLRFIKKGALTIEVTGKTAYIMAPFFKMEISSPVTLYGTLLGGGIVKNDEKHSVNIYSLNMVDTQNVIIDNENDVLKGYFSLPIIYMPQVVVLE